jgi:DNA-binding CsgD family transcriptional regulator
MALTLSAAQTTALASCIEKLDSDGFSDALLSWLDSLTPFNSSVMLAYPDERSLLVLHDALEDGDRAGFDGPYREGLYMLSPLYTQAHAGRRGLFHIDEIAPAGFTHSEFFDLYYSANNCIDQVAYLLAAANGTPIALSLERTAELPPFSIADREQLAAAASIVASLVRRHHWPDAAAPETGLPADMHGHVQQTLHRFGSSVLTAREREVVQLILRGYPSKSVARELDISTQTEQVHRKHIYSKLGIASHSELFSLFFEAVSLPPEDHPDPLQVLRERAATSSHG